MNTAYDFIFTLLLAFVLVMMKQYILALVVVAIYAFYKYNKKKPYLLAYKGNLAFKNGEREKALELYRKSCSYKNVSDSIKLQYAYLTLYLGNLEEASKLLAAIDYEKLPERLRASYTMTESLITWKNGNLKEAIEKLKTLHTEYENTTVYETLGYFLVLDKDYNEALKYNLLAYEYDADNSVIMDNLAQSYYFTGDKEKAKEIYNKLLEQEPSMPEPYYFYGLILKDEGNVEGALEYLDKALTKKESYLSELKKDTIRETIAELKL
ncbi:tetratricopeptide repeat protein [Clostridium sp. B9]|uniref:tetratricopeptide repeat protein n=1 Tax=Clostridium sp. B9 TaxID=3423224 RepID=UPI003D2EFFAD